MAKKEEIQQKIDILEAKIAGPDFWQNKEKAQETLAELRKLKDELEGVGKFDKGNAIVSILSGAGGDDAEDFSAMLYRMYIKYSGNKGWQILPIHMNENDHGGFRNLTFEIFGKNAYGTLKNESGVHRLVRVSPFNAKGQRHTSFSLVEVIPRFEKVSEMPIPESEIRTEFSKSSGPGGQNVNKRETAVRLIHIPTNLSASSDNERSQGQNKEKAMQILAGKLFKFKEEEQRKKEKGLFIKGTLEIEWGNQIRSYVLHPYKMVKDHRTDVETAKVDDVLEGDIDLFIDAEKDVI
ncbi:MAG: PCRF domain-containing protein [bacterium]